MGDWPVTNEASAPPPPSQHREPIEADREAGELVAIQADYVAASELMGRLEDAGMAFSMGQKEWRTMVNTFRNHRLAFSTPAASDAEGYEFDRYVNGVLMAEGVAIERERTLEAACRVAARIASRGPNGEAPVLVLRALPLPKAGEGEA